ncbi:MAG: hypothetical protein OXF29_07925, partial [Hyphomicrobiales bacterium]|nr:hypothetical protein [Hyphomicrobiales bacterium]
LTIKDMGTQMERNAEGFSLGANHRITIPANDNTVGFASAMSTLGEQDTANVEVSVGSNLPSPITLNIATGGNARETRDYTISSPSNKRLVIPAGESSGTITLAGVDDDASPSTAETIELTISVDGNLPPGWTLGSQTTHTVTLQDNDKSVGFESSSFAIDEPGTDTDHTVNIRISSAPAEDVTLRIVRDSGSTADTTGSNIDVTFSPAFVTFTGGDSTNLTKTVTFNVKHDDIKEPAEYIEVMLVDDGTTLTDGENDFSLGTDVYRLTINGSDNTVSIDTSMSDSTLGENGGTADVVVSVDEPSPTPITLNVSAATTSTAQSGDYTLPSTLTIPANSSTGTLTITGVNDDDEVGSLTIDLQFTGNLPTNWAFDPSGSMLTHQITILDDDLGIAGWVSPTGTYTTGSGDYTVSAMLSRSPGRIIELGVSFSGTARRGSDFFVPGTANACSVIRWPMNASVQDLEQSCVITINASAAGKTIIMTLTDSANHLMLEGGFSTTPVPVNHTITVSGPPELGFASPTDTVDAPATANRIHDVTIEISDDTSTAIPFIVEVTGGTKASVGVGGDWSYASQRGCDEASFAANGGRTVTCRLVIFPTAAGKTLTLTIKEAASSTAIADAGFTINPATQMLTVN